MKLIGVSADTSPSRNARVHSSWPPVPARPMQASHSQVIPCGHCHTNNAGINDSGTQNR